MSDQPVTEKKRKSPLGMETGSAPTIGMNDTIAPNMTPSVVYQMQMQAMLRAQREAADRIAKQGGAGHAQPMPPKQQAGPRPSQQNQNGGGGPIGLGMTAEQFAAQQASAKQPTWSPDKTTWGTKTREELPRGLFGGATSQALGFGIPDGQIQKPNIYGMGGLNKPPIGMEDQGIQEPPVGLLSGANGQIGEVYLAEKGFFQDESGNWRNPMTGAIVNPVDFRRPTAASSEVYDKVYDAWRDIPYNNIPEDKLSQMWLDYLNSWNDKTDQMIDTPQTGYNYDYPEYDYGGGGGYNYDYTPTSWDGYNTNYQNFFKSLYWRV